MPNDTNTPGVPDPNVSATAQRAKTGALPEIYQDTSPRYYDQCLRQPGPCQTDDNRIEYTD